MAKAILRGRELECDGRLYDVGSVIGLTLAEDGVAVTFNDGGFLKFDAEPDEFYALGDCCPWANRYIA